MTPHSATKYSYPLMWYVTMESTTAPFYVLDMTRPKNPSHLFLHKK